MSLWDEFKKTLESFGAAQSYGVANLGAGMTAQQATKLGLNAQASTTLASQAVGQATGIGVDETTGVLVSPVEQTTTTLDRYVYSPTYEAAGFTSLIANPDSWTENGKTLNPAEALSKAWNGRREISLGQANADLLAGGLNLLPDYGPLAELNKVDLDIYKKEIRDRIYVRTYNEQGQRVDAAGNLIESASWVEDAFRGFSMATDVTKQLVLDPLWGAGKLGKAARVSKLDVFRPEAIVDTKIWNKEQALVAAAEKTAREEKLKLAIEKPELQRATEVLAQMRSGKMYPDSVVAEVNSVRDAKGLKPFKLDAPQETLISVYAKHVDELKTKSIDRQARISDLNSIESPKPTLAPGISAFVQQIVGRQMNWREIEQHRTLQDFAVEPEFLAKALAEAAKRGEAAVTDVLLLAQGSDPTALIRLRGQHESLLKIIDFAQNKTDKIEVQIQRALNENDPRLAARLNNQKKELSEYIKALKDDDEYLGRLTTVDESIVGSLTGLPFSTSPIIEAFRANKAIFRSALNDGTVKPFNIREKNRPDVEFEWIRVQKGPLHSATYVAQWVGHKIGKERPSGVIVTDGLDRFDGIKEFRVFLDNTPVLDGRVEIKTGLQDAYMNASDSLGRKQVIKDAEKAIVYQTAKRYGLHEEMTIVKQGKKEVERPTWEVIYEAFLQERAKAVAAFERDRVFNVDQNNTLASNPVLESQFAYAVPVIDSKELDNYFYDYSENKSVFKGTWRSVTKAGEEWVLPVYQTFDKFWRADVLIRLGYTQRNVPGEWMVVSQYDTGLMGIFSAGTIKQSGKNFISNRYSHLQDIQSRFQAAIDLADSTDSSKTIAALRSIGPKQFDWVDYEAFARDTIEELRLKRQGIFEFASAFMASKEFATTSFKFPYEDLAKLDAQIAHEESKLAEIAKRVEIKGERFGKGKIRGKGTVPIGPYEFAGVFDGQQGTAVEKLTSSAGRLAFDRNPWSSSLKSMGLEGTGKFTDIHPMDDAYYSTLAQIINQQLQGSRTALMLISGNSNDEILQHLASPAGRAELKKLDWDQEILESPSKAGRSKTVGKVKNEKVKTSIGKMEVFTQSFIEESTPQNYIDYVKNQVLERYLPNDEMKALVKEKLATDSKGVNAGLVTSADLIRTAGDTTLNPIHGEQMELASVFHNKAYSQAQKVGKWLDRNLLERAFKWLGEIPEDAFVSHPFAATVYETKLVEIVDTWIANGIVPTTENLLQAQTIARKWAVSESRKYLYRVVRKNGIGSSMAILSPFFQAQYSTFKRIGKLSYRNPEKSARVLYAWNQVNTHSWQDEDGQRWYTFNVPNSWYDDKGLSNHVPNALKMAIKSQDEARFNVNSFNLLFAGLRMAPPDVLPGTEESTIDKMARWAKAGQSILGTGPIVQLAANQIIKNNPALDDNSPELFGHKLPSRDIVNIFASPYPSENWYDPLMSGWNKRVQSLVFGEGNNDFERTQLVMWQSHVDRQRTGEEPLLSKDPQKNADMLWDMASREAGAFIALRLAVNLSLGFIPTYEGQMTPYVELYRAYQEKYGIKAYDKWLEHYPDMGYVAISRTKNLAGSSASTSAVSLRSTNNEMIEDALDSTGLPREEALSFVQMVTNGEVGAEVLRDPYATYWQKQKGDRLTLTAEEGADSQKIREGWAFFMNDKEAFDAVLKQRKISRYSNAGDAYNLKRRLRLEEYGKQNPAWWKEYTTLSTANSAVGYVRAMKTALNDEKFVNTLSEDSYWWNIQAILRERDAIIGAAKAAGLASPSKEMQALYGMRISTYLQDPTTAYYFSKFLDNDGFIKD